MRMRYTGGDKPIAIEFRLRVHPEGGSCGREILGGGAGEGRGGGGGVPIAVDFQLRVESEERIRLAAVGQRARQKELGELAGRLGAILQGKSEGWGRGVRLVGVRVRLRASGPGSRNLESWRGGCARP